MALVVGVDSSTQSTKVEARDADTGRVVAVGSARHPPTSPPVSEQDPRAWWDAFVAAIGQLGDHRKEVVAISVAGQQHGLVLLDEDGAPVRPAKLWNDTTSAPQAERLVLELGTEQWATLTCSVPVAAFTISKLAWVAEHEPDVLARAERVMLPHDYLTWRLCGAHVTDRGDASGTGWFDPVTGNYQRQLVDLAVGRPWSGELPRVLGPTEVAGTVAGDALAELGLGGDVTVAAG
ncbi:MAG TPA: FGGY family carbohydrate kinase, partial [Ilumatobacter sp.]